MAVSSAPSFCTWCTAVSWNDDELLGFLQCVVLDTFTALGQTNGGGDLGFGPGIFATYPAGHMTFFPSLLDQVSLTAPNAHVRTHVRRLICNTSNFAGNFSAPSNAYGIVP